MSSQIPSLTSMQNKGKIVLEGLIFYAHHGVHYNEQIAGNKFEVDISINLYFDDATFCDELSSTIDYELVYTIAKKEMYRSKKKLMESIAYAIAKQILKSCAKAINTTVTIAKLAPDIGGECKKTKIEVSLTR